MMKHVGAYGMRPSRCAEEVFRHLERGLFYCVVENDLALDGVETQADAAIAVRVRGRRALFQCGCGSTVSILRCMRASAAATFVWSL